MHTNNRKAVNLIAKEAKNMREKRLVRIIQNELINFKNVEYGIIAVCKKTLVLQRMIL